MKLTKLVKQAILEAALNKAGVNEKKAAIRARYAAWAETVRVHFVTPEIQKLLEAAEAASEAVPERFKSRGFIKEERTSVYLNVAGQRREIYWCGSLTYDRQTTEYRTCFDFNTSINSDNPLTEQLYAIDHDAKTLGEEVEQLVASVTSVLDSVTTDKRLIEIWPEAVAFIPAAEKANTPQLPALPIAELNKLIGLP